MLAFILSGAVGLASLLFFFSAFFAPKLHRKDDFLWSGFGFFYASVLWICAQRFSGSILLGQTVAVILILSFAWQTLRLRGTLAKQGLEEIRGFSLLDWLGGRFKKSAKSASSPTPAPATTTEAPAPQSETTESSESSAQSDSPAASTTVETEPSQPSTTESVAPPSQPPTASEISEPEVSETTSEASTETPAPAPPPETEAKPSSPPIKPKSSLFKRLFGKKSDSTSVPVTPASTPLASSEPAQPTETLTETPVVEASPETFTEESNWPESETAEVAATDSEPTQDEITEVIAETTTESVVTEMPEEESPIELEPELENSEDNQQPEASPLSELTPPEAEPEMPMESEEPATDPGIVEVAVDSEAAIPETEALVIEQLDQSLLDVEPFLGSNDETKLETAGRAAAEQAESGLEESEGSITEAETPETLESETTPMAEEPADSNPDEKTES